jgi:hypothetical protein
VLYLVHYPVGKFNGDRLVQEAAAVFKGEVSLAVDFQKIILG